MTYGCGRAKGPSLVITLVGSEGRDLKLQVLGHLKVAALSDAVQEHAFLCSLEPDIKQLCGEVLFDKAVSFAARQRVGLDTRDSGGSILVLVNSARLAPAFGNVKTMDTVVSRNGGLLQLCLGLLDSVLEDVLGVCVTQQLDVDVGYTQSIQGIDSGELAGRLEVFYAVARGSAGGRERVPAERWPKSCGSHSGSR